MLATLATLLLAATLEVTGDAVIRLGLVRGPRAWVALGAVLLVAYGFFVNANRTLDFGRLLGLYIVIFFLVSQGLGWAIFGERPSLGLLAGGGLIVAGGVVLQLAR